MRQQLGLLVLIGLTAVGLDVSFGLSAEIQGLQTITLRIDGMTCGACINDVKAALTKVPGVSAVDFTVAKEWIFFSDYSDARALVTFDPKKTDLETLVKAVEAAGNPLSAYRARLLEK